jgi:hypothetical protein
MAKLCRGLFYLSKELYVLSLFLILPLQTPTAEVVKTAATIPWVNLAIIVVGLIVILWLMRRFGIKNFLGIQMGIEDNDSIASMNNKNKEADENLKSRMRDFIEEFGPTMEIGITSNRVVAHSLSQALQSTFYNTVNNNHLRKSLMNDEIESYTEKLLIRMENKYHIIENLESNILPPISETREIVTGWRDQFITMLKKETLTTCKEKLKNYRDYEEYLQTAKNKKIVKVGIKKHEESIRELER